MDRVLFGSNTILVFKYPLLKRKLQHVKDSLLNDNPGLQEDELEAKACELLASMSLYDTQDEESKEADEEDQRRALITVADY